MKRLISLIRKEFIQILRDKNMMKLIVIIPILQTILLGFAISNELRNQSLIIVDLDQSTQSRDLINQFRHTDRFIVSEVTQDINQIHKQIRIWKCNAGIIIPRNFGKDLVMERKPQIELVFDAVDGNTAGIAIQYIGKIISDFALEYSSVKPQIIMNDRSWYNADMKPYQYMVPGIVAVLVTIISMLFSSMALVREKEVGTLEQLMVTPIKKWELLAGKLIPFLILSLIEFYFALFVGQFVFGIRMQGSYLLMSILTTIYLFTTLGLGVSISVISQTQQQAMFFSWFFMLFMTLLSGLFMPVSNMPDSIRWITYLNPMMYFVNITREVFQKGNQFAYLFRDIVPLFVYGVTVFTFSVLKFHKRID
jgi:ABC-2 type transport system permease protein